jgi:outer membrane protein assembly factor BamD
LGRNAILTIASRWIMGAATAALLMNATGANAQILHKKKKVNKSTSVENNAQPDKILYDKAIEDIRKGRHETGRLNLQTLINTYPDSEYLAKAKMGIADSFYKEGGTANLTQAIQAYKDFGVFFPFLPEAAYAQLQVAMTHYKQMEKPDRDRTAARAAEEEFQTFLSKFPNDPLAGKAEQHLREVQEVLAEGDFRIGYYYYVKGDPRAAESRLKAVAFRYPLYSKADRALWMLGNLWEKTEKKEISAPYYARIVRDYPLSPLAPSAKNRLKALKAPVPQPDPKAVAWMTAEKNAPRQHQSLLMRPTRLFNSGPRDELQTAAKTGPPTMTPAGENESGVDILSGGNRSTLGGGPGTGIVATVTPGSNGAAESTTTTSDSGSDPTATNGAAGGSSGTQPQPEAAAASGSTNPPADPAKTDSAAATDATNPDAAKVDPATADATKTDAGTGAKPDPKKESTSKKKKGLRKIVPW